MILQKKTGKFKFSFFLKQHTRYYYYIIPYSPPPLIYFFSKNNFSKSMYPLLSLTFFVLFCSTTIITIVCSEEVIKEVHSLQEAEEQLRIQGIALYRNEDFESAAQLFSKAITLNPSNAANHAYLANAIYKAGERVSLDENTREDESHEMATDGYIQY